ncbi:hypothetical protein GGR50DRAFT_475993 [Xylaria sp. CBS 124048]|nr:hypothetical protein GGR50DRAFT_475993 [Xylaria sp. CBS 124048]
MAMINQAAWHAQDHSMSSPGDDEFHQFFDISMSNMANSMQFDFQDFNPPNGQSIMQHAHRDPIDTPMSDANVSPIVAHNNVEGTQNQVPPMPSALNHPSVPPQILPSQASPNDAISEIDAQIRFLQHQRLQQQQLQLEEQQRRLQEQQAAFYAQQQRSRNRVPPTPRSLEIQAAGQYYASQDQGHSSGMFEQYQQVKEHQDMAFTPLASPAVTPLDTHFPVDHQFMIPSAYFSPITSPALHAQVDSAMFYDPRHSSHTSNSPAATDTGSPLVSTATDTLTREGRKNSVPRRKPKVRQSPITRPQKKKATSTPVMNAQALSELEEVIGEATGTATKAKSVSVSSNEDSENASVSPEALEMPPPPLPVPRSARPSPRIASQNNEHPAPVPALNFQNGKPSPATPASLFRISPRNQTADQSHCDPNIVENIESFELPASIQSTHPSESQPSQVLNARQSPHLSSGGVETPKITPLHPLSSPHAMKPTQPTSASQSPQLNPRPSSSASKKTPVQMPKGSRKRPSISISPALLPKISPNIKPLLPGTPGLSSEDSASILLASKSNYQRILEGSTVPGVTYPSELSTNLTSKRTSHKIAEQGRRNRINSALQEIATLLPRGTFKESGDGDGDDASGDRSESKQLNVPNSKASTVESAIEYIKHLQKELAAAHKRAEEAEEKLREAK